VSDPIIAPALGAGTRPSAGGRLAAVVRAPAWVLTGILAGGYLILAPQSPDLAAASYRSALFASQGFTLWDNSWYGGHHLPAYSLIAPALGALVGPALIVALSMTAASALFAALLGERLRTDAGRLATLAFAWGAAVSLLSSRVPFDLGLAIGLGALLAALRARFVAAAALSVACSFASPVAGAFLALAAIAVALAGPRRLAPALLAVAALVPIALLAIVFPEGGTQPFAGSAFYPALAGVVAVGALFPARWRPMRIGALLYGAAMIGAYAIESPVGGNVDRLGSLVAAPLAALAAGGAPRGSPRRWALIVLALPLLYWQANAPVADFAAAASDPGTSSAFYRPLLGELRSLGVGYGARPARIEVVPLADHWEARWVAPSQMLARGWERQLDRLRNPLFYSGAPLTAERYGAWLRSQSIAYVALSDSAPDYSGRAEEQLLRGRAVSGSGVAATGVAPSYLSRVWSSRHWTLFAVRAPTPLATAPATLIGAGHDWFTLSVPRAGAYTARIHFTSYWLPDVRGACVARASGDWTAVSATRPGAVRVEISFSLGRVLDHGRRCNR
jgi:hypothetical protein